MVTTPIEEEYILSMPKVRTSDGHYVEWDRDNVINQIVKDTQLCKKFYDYPPAERKLAEEIAEDVENAIMDLDVKYLKASMVRELVCLEFLKRGMIEYHNMCARVGTSMHDAHMIDTGVGYGANDNANLQANPETSHKHKADKLSKEQYLLMFPPKISDAHLKSYIHIHDLEYFGTRTFCMDHDLRYLFYYGFMPDGKGSSASVSAPAKNPEVATLHAVKMLAAAQTNFAGGQGFYNFLTFLAPYFEGLEYKQIKQYMQMLVYELTQMMVARGGQSLSASELLILRHNDDKISLTTIGEFCHNYLSGEGTLVFDDEDIQTLSLNKITGDIEWKPVTGVYVHKPASPLVKTILTNGRNVTTTSDHSLFTLDEDCNIIEIKPSDEVKTILVSEKIEFSGKDYDPDLMFLIGVSIGDGNLVDNNGNPSSALNIALSNDATRERFDNIVKKYTKTSFTWSDKNNFKNARIPTLNIPFITEIGIGAHNKKIPAELLSASNISLYALLDGLLSTDGNVARRRYEYNTTSKILAQQIEFILLRLGLQYSIYVSSKKSNFNRNYPLWTIRICAQDSQKIKITNSSRQFDGISSIEQQKHDFSVIKPLIKQLVPGIYKYGYAFRSTTRKLKKKNIDKIKDKIPDIWNKIKNILPMEVKSVEPIEKEEFVYDIGVKDNENFILHNGIVAHNTVFSSLQLSPGVPTLWHDKPIVYKGRIWNGEQAPLRTYVEFEREVRLLFKTLMEVMLEGDYWNKPFNFPKPEISIEPDFVEINDEIKKWDAEHPDLPTYEELYIMSFELASRHGTPYFDNQMPQYRGAGKGISCYQCSLSADTKIIIKRNNNIQFCRADELNTDDELLTPNGFKQMESLLIHDIETISKITFEGGKFFKCTDDHRIPVLRNKEIQLLPASDICTGDSIPQLSNLPTDGKIPLYIDTDSYNDIFDFCYLLGLFAAEGSTHVSQSIPSGVNKHIVFSLGSHETVLIDTTCNIIKKLFNYDAKVYPNNGGRGVSIIIHSNNIYDWFMENNIIHKPSEQFVPSFIFTAPVEYKFAFLHGYFVGDGCLRKNGKKSNYEIVEMNSISENLALGVVTLFTSLGYHARYGRYIDKRENRKERHIIYLSRINEIEDFINMKKRDEIPFAIIKRIERLPYSDKVYDPINVDGHQFYLANGILTGNCAYQFGATPDSDPEFFDKLYFKDGAHFAMGSGQVVTLNCPRAAYDSGKYPNRLVDNLKKYMDIAKDVFLIKRRWINEIIAYDKLPFLTQRPRDPITGELGAQAIYVDDLVYTIGVLGFNEMVQYVTGKQIHESKDARKTALYVLSELNAYARKLSKETGLEIVVARTPAETTGQRFAVADLLNPLYSDKARTVVKGNLAAFEEQYKFTRNLPVYYTNGTHTAVNAPINIVERMKIESPFFLLVQGGNIFHIFMGESRPDPIGLYKFGMNIAKNSQIGYFAFTRDVTIPMHKFKMYKGSYE